MDEFSRRKKDLNQKLDDQLLDIDAKMNSKADEFSRKMRILNQKLDDQLLDLRVSTIRQAFSKVPGVKAEMVDPVLALAKKHMKKDISLVDLFVSFFRISVQSQ